MNPVLLELKQLTLTAGDRLLCRELDLQVSDNQCWGLLGRNGAGKTSLLHCIMGIRRAQSGSIHLAGRDLGEIPRRQLAMQVGILFQDETESLPATVMETVLLGRHPHVQSILRDDEEDIETALAALEDLQLKELAARRVDTLSGGERQRLALARLLAQSPRLYLLDEPSNHLDVAFQVRLLDLLQTRIRQQDSSMIMATHDINLAARFCDHIVLMLEQGECLLGTTQQVLTEVNLAAAYGCSISAIESGELTFYYPARERISLPD